MGIDKVLNYKYFLLMPLGYIIAYIIQYWGLTPLVYLIFFGGIVLTIVKPKQGVYFWILILLIFDDIPFNLKTETQFSSIFTETIGGQTLTKILSLLFVGLIAHRIIITRKLIIGNQFVKIFGLLFLIAIITGIVKGNVNFINPFITDFRFFLNFIIGFYLVVYFLNEKFEKLIPIMSIVFIVKTISLIILSITIAKTQKLYTITADTGSYLGVFVNLFFLYLISHQKKFKIYGYIGLFLGFLLLGISASRGRFIILAMAIFLYLFAIRKTKYFPFIVGGAASILLIIPFVSPEMYDFLIWKLTSFKPEEGTGESSFVRFVEYINILHHNFTSTSSFLVGEGLGGYWTSEYFFYPFDLKGTTSYPNDWIRNDRFFKPHGIVQFLFLKNGFVGAMVFYTSLLLLFLKSWRNYFKNIKINNHITFMNIILTAGMIPFYLVAFSAKLQLMGGVLFGIFYCYSKKLELERNNNS